MGTKIETWQIINGELHAIDTTMQNEGRTEPFDLEPWIESKPEIIGTDIMIIGRQVKTNSGPIDLLGIDKSGNTVIIELKRDRLPRESLAQAIDYASNVAGWTIDKLSDVCLQKRGKSLEDAFNETFPDLENISFNSTQRIILVGFFIDTALERMIEWLSDTYDVNINAVILSYVKTEKTEGHVEHELLLKTSLITDETYSGDPLDPPRRTHLEYWTAFIKFLQEHNSNLKIAKPIPWSYLGAPIGKSSASIGAHIHIKSQKIAVQLYITGPNAKYYFKHLQDEKDAIESKFGNEIWQELVWKDSAEKTKNISLFKEDVDVEDRKNWPQQHQWLYENLELFYRAFAEQIQNFQSDDSIDGINEADTTT